MNITISQDKIEYFLNNYFKQLWFKFFIFQEIIWILVCYFEHYYILSSIILSFVIIISSFLTSKFLHKENLKLIVEFYGKNNIRFKANKKSNKEITLICNLKKFNGPTFGALTLNSNSLMFTPFKENLKNEKFIVNNIKNPNVHISVVNVMNSLINKVFFKGNLCCLELKFDDKKFVLQMPKDDSIKLLFE
ncbi:hypothetical protein [Clostridium sp. CF012]|uniref:hypothetical protein n=1 Tax=Clostridium sp. CF012 TaxID=2843319 RepID=UPI001C0DCBA2|nr:hypothetical protein [Clostridium sp. CF012]MBU3144053.1 hypothetical protein [Clostridium sp. CF012]